MQQFAVVDKINKNPMNRFRLIDSKRWIYFLPEEKMFDGFELYGATSDEDLMQSESRMSFRTDPCVDTLSS